MCDWRRLFKILKRDYHNEKYVEAQEKLIEIRTKLLMYNEKLEDMKIEQ